MRTYYDLIQRLKAIFDSDPLVNTVSTDGNIDLDNWKKNIYPIVDIYVVDEPYISDTTAVSQYNVEITVLDVRDVNKEQVNDKFYLNDNRHDNWNTTGGILKLGRNKLIKDTTNTDITLNTASAATRFVNVKENTLDGWQQTWTIDVPDTLTTVCG